MRTIVTLSESVDKMLRVYTVHTRNSIARPKAKLSKKGYEITFERRKVNIEQ